MPIDEHLAFDTTSVELHLHWLTLRYGIEVRLLIADLRSRYGDQKGDRIRLSRYISSDAQAIDTLRHEYAHAAAELKHRSQAGHARLGASPPRWAPVLAAAVKARSSPSLSWSPPAPPAATSTPPSPAAPAAPAAAPAAPHAWIGAPSSRRASRRGAACKSTPRQATTSLILDNTLSTSTSDAAPPDAHRRATPRFPLLLRLSKGRAKPQLPPAVAPSFPPFPSG